MKIIATIVALFVALFNCPAIGQDLVPIDVIATGAHPSGSQWDGFRVYFLPFETSTVSPPEIEVCIVQDDVVCGAQVGEGWNPRCPDSEKCRFEVAVDTLRPFGIVIYDIDALGQDAIQGAADAAASMSQSLNGQGIPDWALPAVESLGGLAAGSGRTLTHVNAQRLEWMDAVIVVPIGMDAPPDMADRMRSHARSFERPAPFGNHAARMSAPFDVHTIEACAWPGPPCLLGYTTIQFYNEETSYAD